MKKTYVSPVVEKLEFDYTNVVATSTGLGLFGTSTEQWCHKEEKPTEGITVKCVTVKPTEGIVVKCVA